MKTPGTVHLLRATGRTSCGQLFNKVTMIASVDPDDVTCRQCLKTRLYHKKLNEG